MFFVFLVDGPVLLFSETLKNQQATCNDTGDWQSGDPPAHPLRSGCSRSWRWRPCEHRHVSVRFVFSCFMYDCLLIRTSVYLLKHFPRATFLYASFHFCFLIVFPVHRRASRPFPSLLQLRYPKTDISVLTSGLHFL